MSTNLVLHAGAKACSRDAVRAVATPEAVGGWYPVPHSTIIDLVHENIAREGQEIAAEHYGLWKEGARFFGTFHLKPAPGADYGVVVGLRNSHDKAFSAGLVMGSRVFVCDNLAFSGEVHIARKHTKYIMRDLPRLAAEAVGKLGNLRLAQDERIARYKRAELFDAQVHDFVVRAVDAGVVANARVPDVLHQWRKPELEDFRPRTVWSLFNAFTEVLKDVGQDGLSRRTIALHGLADQVSV